jgi:hypothetical protein
MDTSQPNSFSERVWKAYAGNDEKPTGGWEEECFEEYEGSADLIWAHTTDSGNFASGDESEKIWELAELLNSYWTRSTSAGIQGPFETMDEAAKALGYSSFNDLPEEDTDDEECDEEE